MSFAPFACITGLLSVYLRKLELVFFLIFIKSSIDKGIACHAMRNEVIKVVVLQLVFIFSIDVEWLVSPANVWRRGVGEGTWGREYSHQWLLESHILAGWCCNICCSYYGIYLLFRMDWELRSRSSISSSSRCWILVISILIESRLKTAFVCIKITHTQDIYYI